MIPNDLAILLCAAVAVVGLMAYALLGGADFGGGVWDLFATGPRKKAQREAIAHAMGPVWEANHVWLIFVIVILFTCFPKGYAALATALFLPFHLALLGIMLRGGAFVFRAYAHPTTEKLSLQNPVLWEHIFGISSVIAPLLLGATFGTVTAGTSRGDDGPLPAWLSPYPLACGFLALSTCAYLAAVYLCVETTGRLRDDFRIRAIIAGTSTAALAFVTLYLAYFEARWFVNQLLAPRSLPVIAAGLLAFAASAYAVFSRRYKLARICAAAEIALLLIGWALAQHPYLVYPTFTLHEAAAPIATLQFTLIALPFGLAALLPSLYLLFKVFKASPAGENFTAG